MKQPKTEGRTYEQRSSLGESRTEQAPLTAERRAEGTVRNEGSAAELRRQEEESARSAREAERSGGGKSRGRGHD